jgi:hypothetical protein
MDQLIEKLSTGSHKIVAGQYKTPSELKEALDRGYVLLKFTETRGGTELGVRVDKSRLNLDGVDFQQGTGKIDIVGGLVLNYNEIELSANVDLATLEGQGSIKVIADEPTWRAKQAELAKEKATH